MAAPAARTVALRAKDGGPALDVGLRPFGAGDGPLYEAFWRKFVTESTHTMQTAEFPPDFSTMEERWAVALADPVELRLGAFVRDGGGARLAGLIGFHAERPGHPWTRHLGGFGMMVLEEFQGRGLGRALLDAMTDHARSLGVVKIEAMVRVENERGLRLYTSAGFRIEGRRTRGAKIDGRFRDEYWIAKDLDGFAPPA